MNLSCSKIKLHPQAQDLLFKHYRTLTRIFQDVLGHLEIDYMAIALLNPMNELFFLSSKPSIESNLIQNDLWQFDASIQQDFFMQNKAQLWEDLYHDEWRAPLRHYKQDIPKFSMGLSVSSFFEDYRVVYSFALKSTDEVIKNKILSKIETLICIGRFCLQNIIKAIPLPDRQHGLAVKKPSLRLIINNKAHYENNT